MRPISPAVSSWIRQTRLRFAAKIQERDDLALLGDDYGAWVIPTSLLNSDSICYCAGVGEDITFDLALIERYGCRVHAFDPTPRAIQHVERTVAPGVPYAFHSYGLWSSDTTLRFYAPRNPRHVSHSAVNLQGTDEYFEAPVKRLSTAMKELGHDHLDLLKIDIEGAEYEVLADMITSNIRPLVLCVEFDQPMPIRRTLQTINQVKAVGYQVVAQRQWNFTFVFTSGESAAI